MYQKMTRTLQARAITNWPRAAILMTLMLIFSSYSFGQSANMLISPASTNTQVGQSFVVNVRVDMLSGQCNAFEIHLNFNTSYLRITNVAQLNSGLFSSVAIPLPSNYTTVNSTGHLEFAAGIPSGTVSADFDAIAITFTTQTPPQTGTTNITLQNSPGHRSRVVQGSTNITNSLVGGSVNISGCVPPSATLAVDNSASFCNGQPVGLKLTSMSGASPFSVVVNGTTYNNVTLNSTFANLPFPTYQFWTNSPTPLIPNGNDGDDIEVGAKFRTTQSGFIKAIRFYNGFSSPSGTYTVKLYNYGEATLISSLNAGSISGIGWKEINFASPVPIAANTTYLASVYSTAGNYAYTDNEPGTTNGITNGPLSLLPNNGLGGPNGVYSFGPDAPGMPNTPYSATNYWVDVVFVSNTNTINLTSITDAGGCNTTGSPIQSINVVSASCSSLPVELISFSATPGDRKVALRWRTVQELNNKGFDIYRSKDASNWTRIGFVMGAGTTDMPTDYSYTDENLALGKYYYQLKQIDFDEKWRYSSVVFATLNGKSDYSLGQSYPNPTKEEAVIQFTLPRAEKVNISLYDMNGRLMRTMVNGTVDAGTHNIYFKKGMLARGVYYYKMTTGNFSDVKKLTIQ